MMNILYVGAFAVASLIVLLLTKLWQDVITLYNDDDEIESKANMAIVARRAGIYIAIALGLAGALSTNGTGFWGRMKIFCIDAIVILILVAIVGWVNDRLLLNKVDNNAEIGKGNLAVGIAEFGSFIAMGLILWASFTGEGGGVWSAVAFTLLGQLALIAIYWLYEVMTPWSAGGEIAGGNVAAGIAVCGKLLALGIILASSIAGPFVSWEKDITLFGISALIGIVLLLIFEKISDWLFLPNTTIQTDVKNRNCAAIALAQGTIIALAIIVASVI